MLIGKSSKHEHFSIAMLDYQRIYSRATCIRTYEHSILVLVGYDLISTRDTHVAKSGPIPLLMSGYICLGN